LKGVVCAVTNYRLVHAPRLLHFAIAVSVASMLSAFFAMVFVCAEFFLGFPLLGLRSLGITFTVAFCLAMLIAAYIEHDHQTKNVQHPEQVHDVAAALGWMYHHVAEYGGDPDSIFLGGHSAGGHLTTLLALNPSYLEQVGYDKEILKSVKGLFSLSGVFHLGRLNKSMISRQLYVRPVFGTDRKVHREASPITYASQRLHFRVLFLNAQRDFHLRRDAVELQKALIEAGNSDVRCVMVEKTSHRSILACIDTKNDRVSPLIVQFITQETEESEPDKS